MPLESHFENFPRIDSDSDPPAPDFRETDPPPPDPVPNEDGSRLNSGPYQSVEGSSPQTPFLHPDDAADFPTIRMARAPPSPKSPKSPRSPKFKPTPPADPLRSPSRGSYASSKTPHEDTSFGTITAEPGPRVSAAPSIASSSSGGRKSIKGQLTLVKKSSREFLQGKEKPTDRLRKTSSFNDSLRSGGLRKRASLRSMHSMADVAEEGRPNDVVSETQRDNAASASSSHDRHSLQSVKETPTSGGIGSGRVIPPRESSLRHSFSSSSKRRRSARHSRYSSTGSKDIKVESGVVAGATEADQVAKRIQELKDQRQKIKTELETDNSPAKSIKEKPSRQAAAPQTPKKSNEKREPNGVDAVGADERSAPSPSVGTGKSSSKAGAGSPQVKMSQTPKQSPEKFDRNENMNRQRRSLESSTPARHHQRFHSAQISAVHTSNVDERPSSADSIDFAVADYVHSPKLSQKVHHPASDRVIAFSEVGDPNGHVVLCCLGMGLTRYLMAFYDELARTLKLRLITLDRPGIGESGPYVDESGNPLSWPGKSRRLAPLLKLT